jgi:hypothetical protein
VSPKRTLGIVLAAGLAYIVIKGIVNAPTSPTGPTYTGSTPVVEYPESAATYAQVNADIGCKSTYSDQKKDDIFNAKYKNHWMTWKGQIALLESDEVSLNVDGVGTQDLQVDFADKQAGYDLSKGSQLKVRFLMETAGGCFLPFGGREATVVR